MINANKTPAQWQADTERSVALYNDWYKRFAPEAFAKARSLVEEQVRRALSKTGDLRRLTWEVLRDDPKVLEGLRMMTAPPIARDRLTGLAGVTSRSLVNSMEAGRLLVSYRKLLSKSPSELTSGQLEQRERYVANLRALVSVLAEMADPEVLPWLGEDRPPTEEERSRAALIVADRLAQSKADPAIRNRQEARQLERIEEFLTARGYELVEKLPAPGDVTSMDPGTYAFRVNAKAADNWVPVDVAIQPKKAKKGDVPVLVEAKSAGDFANVNKRRKEEAQKARQLQETYPTVVYLLYLTGYFNETYLAYEAKAGIDWVWEHRTEDFEKAGI